MTAEQRTGPENPFPGLRPFETDEYRVFFGREGQSDALVERLGRSRFLAVVGTSGSGKSSLVRAGLLPALRGGMMAGAGSGWRIALTRPGHDPVGNLARALAAEGVLAEAGAGLPPAEAEAAVEATLRRGSLGLVEAAARARLGGREKLLVVVDQFEELFRFRAARAAAGAIDDAAAAFVKLLLEAAAQREVPVYVVLTMRSDFLGDCAQFQGLPEAINDGQYLIPRMTRDERRFAIVGPVRVARARMSEPLVNRLLNDVGDNPDQLPILQHALMRTWEHWAGHRADSEPLGLDDYEAVGTMSGALSRHADEAWAELPDERSRHVAETLFKALTERAADSRETRHPTSIAEICEIAGAAPDEVASVVEVFRREGRSFLTPPTPAALTPSTVIDISHESLIRNWVRLKKWVDEEARSARIYRRVAESAALHRAGQESLAAGAGLQVALDWREKARPNAAWASRYHPAFAETMKFLDESKAVHEAEVAERERRREEQLARDRRELEQAQRFAAEQQRAARRLRGMMFVLVLVSLVALGAAGGSAFLYRAAEANRKEAVTSKEQAVRDRERAERAEQAALAERNNAREAAKAAEQAAEAQRAAAMAAEEAKDAALVAQREAKDAQKRAEAEKAHAVRLAASEEAARARAENTKSAGQFFRDALANFDRAEFSDEVNEAYSEINDSVDRFKEVGDFGGAAAAYIKLGAAREQFVDADGSPLGDGGFLRVRGEDKVELRDKVKLWDEAVANYRLSRNYMKTGETLEDIGDELLAREIRKQGPPPRPGEGLAEEAGQRGAVKAEEDWEEIAQQLETKIQQVGTTGARDEIARRYGAALCEYQKAAGAPCPEESQTNAPVFKPQGVRDSLLRSMRLILIKKAVFHESLGEPAKAVESYRQLMALEGKEDDHTLARANFRIVKSRLIRLYYSMGRGEEARSLAEALREAERRRAGEDGAKTGEAEAEAVRTLATVLADRPEAPDYVALSAELFRKHNPRRESSVYYNMGNAVKKIEERKKLLGRPLSDANYRLALGYYLRALSYYKPPPAPQPYGIPATNVWERMAELHDMAGYPREAAETYRELIRLTHKLFGPGDSRGVRRLYRKLIRIQETARLPEVAETYGEFLKLVQGPGAPR